MNYEKKFLGMPPLNKQRIIPYGELIGINSGKVLPDSAVDSYNQYTKDFNATSWRPTQEKLLDNRHKFFISL